MATKTRMTVEEYLALPDEKPYLEYYDGEVVAKPMPKRKHVALARRVSARIDRHMETHGGFGGPEPQVWFHDAGQDHFLLPDVAYWAPGKPVGDDERMLPPTLAVEVRSPEQTMAAQRRKCRFYREHGVEVCWLVDPESRTVEVFDGATDGVRPDDDRLTSLHLPGFALELAELWRALD